MSIATKTKSKIIPNTLVIDLDNNTYYLEYLPDPPGLQEWYYDGNWVYWVKKHGEDLEPVTLPGDIDFLPEDLYMLLNWKNEAKTLFAIKPTAMEKIKLGLVVVLIGIFIFTLFLIVSSG